MLLIDRRHGEVVEIERLGRSLSLIGVLFPDAEDSGGVTLGVHLHAESPPLGFFWEHQLFVRLAWGDRLALCHDSKVFCHVTARPGSRGGPEFVRLGFDAPQDVKIYRPEYRRKLERGLPKESEN